MTIHEAIKICHEEAEKIGGNPQSDRHAERCRQLAEWLTELKELKAAGAQPVKRGHWQITMMSEATGWDLSVTGGHDEVCEYQCSVCGKSNILDEFGESFLPPYCPFCGAKMENHETIKG